jgi:predicted extracellular nuclease
MQTKAIKFLSAIIIFVMMIGLAPGGTQRVQAIQAQSVGFTGMTYSQNFDTLATSGTTNVWTDDTGTLAGWYAAKSVAPNNITTYRADSGTSNTGALYSYGTGTTTERALGSASSGTPGTIYYGVQFTNNTGVTIGSLNISFNGEQWRNGGNTSAQTLAFHYQVGATSLITGTWTSVTALDFVTPTVGATIAALDGNAAANRTAKSGSITGLSLAPGGTIWLRWMDINDASNDHGVAIDDLTVTAVAAGSALSIDNVTQVEGDSGTTIFTFTVSLSSPAPAGGVTFDIATADGTATLADNDYAANSLSGQTIAAGNTTYTFDVTVNGDTATETTEAFAVNVTNVTGATVADGVGVGTITNDDAVIPALSINDVTVTEGDSGTVTASFTVSLDIPAGAGGVTFDIATADGTATTANFDYVLNSLTGRTIAAGNSTYTFDVLVYGDTSVESTETFAVNVTNVIGATLSDGSGVGTITNDDIILTPTYTIQGTVETSPYMNQVVTTQGIVVGDYEGGVSPQIRGFFIQDVTGDSNTTTSDGLFVYNGSSDNVALGDLVRITGTVSEYQGQTQITPSAITILSHSNTLPPTNINLPFATSTTPEQYEGMLVRFNQTLYVTEHYQLGRFGEVLLSSGTRLYQPSNIVLPGAPAIAMQAINNLNQILMDDATNTENPDPIVFGRNQLGLSASNTLRGGDTITDLVGVFMFTWGGNATFSPNAYRIRPINALGGNLPNIVAANPRPSTPNPVGGTLKVVGMNVLNYFNSFSGCYPSGTGTGDCRGAGDAAEFTRQSDKLVNVITTINPDVLGVAEMENDGYGATSAIQDLVNKLNAKVGVPGTYAFIDVDAAIGHAHALGNDAIKVDFIYKPATVTPVGSTAVLDSVAFVNGGDGSPRNRVSLLQAFQQNSTGERFLANINHFKSKGSACDVPDSGDGQANCPIVRTNAANALTAWLGTNPTGTGDPDIVILGDLNSYAREDPIRALESAGFTNMVKHFGDNNSYSYVYDGQWGYLDYALGSTSLLAQTRGVTEFHINSDEPAILDYNTDYKSIGQQASLYSSDPFRSSDHDPIIVGLNLDTVSPTVTINHAISQADPTGASPVNFTVIFSEPVTGFATGDVTVSGTAGATIGTVTEAAPNNGTTYNVAVSGMTAYGTVTASVAAGKALDAAGNSNLASTTSGTVTYGVSALASPDGIVNSWDHNFNWTGVSGATWYLLEVQTPDGTELLRKWYTAAQAGCSGDLDCAISPAELMNLANGDYKWHIQDYGAFGIWSGYKSFSLNTNCYTLNTATNPLGGGAFSATAQNCAGGYTAGTVIQVTVTPSTGYVFTNWGGDASGSTNPVSVTMDGNKSVLANLRGVVLTAPNGEQTNWNHNFTWEGVSGATWYFLEVQTTTGTNVLRKWYTSTSTNCSGDLGCVLTPAELAALANGDYQWRIQDFGAYGYGAWTTLMPFTLNGACHTLSTAIAPIGSATINATAENCAGGYTAGSTIQLTVLPAPGFVFLNWSGDASGSLNPLSVTMDSSRNITANLRGGTLITPTGEQTNWNHTFSWNGISGATWYFLEVQTSAGVEVLRKWYTASAADCSGDLSCAVTPAELATIANGDYKWRIQDYGAYGYGAWTAFLPFNLNGACYSLTTSVEPVGSGIFNATSQNCTGGYTAGTTVQLTLVPTTGYVFLNWSGDVSGSLNPLSVTMDGNKSMTANLRGTSLIAPTGSLSGWDHTFTWTGANGATWYFLEVQTSGGTVVLYKWYTAAAASCAGDLSCFLTPAELAGLPNGDYQWRVQDYGAYGYGIWTAFMPFSLVP